MNESDFGSDEEEEEIEEFLDDYWIDDDEVDDNDKLVRSQRLSRSYSEELYELVSVLGEGAFGKVFKVRHKIDNLQYALKVVKLSANKEDA